MQSKCFTDEYPHLP